MPIRVSISTIGFPLVMWSYPRLSATKVNGVVGCVKPRVAVFRRAGRTFPSMDWAPEVVSFEIQISISDQLLGPAGKLSKSVS